MLAEETLVRVARILRAYHDATADFPLAPSFVWQWPGTSRAR